MEDALECARADVRRLSHDVSGLMAIREEADREAARLASELAQVCIFVCFCLLPECVLWWLSIKQSHILPLSEKNRQNNQAPKLTKRHT
jgi:hypothetical protein